MAIRRPRTAAGRRLVDDQHEALRRAGEEAGVALVWSETEEAALERAGQTVDRAERLRKVFDDEMRGDAHPAVLVKISGELRQLDRQVIALLAQLNPEGEDTPKSERHQRAARSRWTSKGGA